MVVVPTPIPIAVWVPPLRTAAASRGICRTMSLSEVGKFPSASYFFVSFCPLDLVATPLPLGAMPVAMAARCPDACA